MPEATPGYTAFTSHQEDIDGYTSVTFTDAGHTASDKGFSGGVQVGYNWQRCNTLVGVEADWSWADLDANTRVGFLGFPVATMTTTLNNFGTIRGRAGLVMDNLLLYVTGGLAFADVDFRVTNNLFVETASFSEKRWGWTAGFGTEWALWDRVSLKSEVLYVSLGDENYTFASALGPTFSFKSDDSFWVTRFGVNIKFGCDRGWC
jgi:outer membrane immunogenic protein